MSSKKEILESRLKKWEQEKRNAKPGDILILDFSGMDYRFIPFIPEGATKLNFANNKLNMVKSIPYFLTYINLSSNYIKNIPSFPDKLETIILSKNDLTIIPELPKNLKYLQINENRLVSLPKLPKKLEFLDVSSNNLKSLPDIPDTLLNVNASTNSISSIGKISKNIVTLNLKSNNLKNLPVELPDSLKNLDLSYNKFETMPIVPSYTKMNISNNPLYINLRKLQPKYITTHKFSESSESEDSSDSSNLYKTVKIPKGTVLFHSAKRMEQFSELFVGYPYKSGTESEFRLHPQHLSFFYLSPSFQRSEYGPNEGLFILTKDIEVVLGLLPSKDTKRQIELKYQEDCKNLDYDTAIEQKYECFKRDFPNKAGYLTQGYRNFKTDPEVEKFNYFYSYFEDFEGNLNIPELVIHPRKERMQKDLILPKSDFSYTWLDKHIDEYMFKPFFIFEHKLEEGIPSSKSLFDYVYKLKVLLSPEGFTDDSGTYHMTIHKDEGFYMIAEYTSPEVLNECLSVSDPEKEEFLKKIKVS
jgi:hypothetical protein